MKNLKALHEYISTAPDHVIINFTDSRKGEHAFSIGFNDYEFRCENGEPVSLWKFNDNWLSGILVEEEESASILEQLKQAA